MNERVDGRTWLTGGDDWGRAGHALWPGVAGRKALEAMTGRCGRPEADVIEVGHARGKRHHRRFRKDRRRDRAAFGGPEGPLEQGAVLAPLEKRFLQTADVQHLASHTHHVQDLVELLLTRIRQLRHVIAAWGENRAFCCE